MADVQLENGYTRIANEILEALAKAPLNGTQFRIVMLVVRETYGFQRKSCSLSETYIASRLKIQRQNIHREMKELFTSKVLSTIQEATFVSPRIIALNKNYSEWRIRLQESKKIAGIELDSSPAIENDSSPGIGLDSHRKKPLKKPLKKNMPGVKTPDSPTAISLMLNDKTEFPVSEAKVKEWAALYPAVDTMQELRKMKGWLDVNPAKRKTKRGIQRFINGWLAREQDRGGVGYNARPPADDNWKGLPRL